MLSSSDKNSYFINYRTSPLPNNIIEDAWVQYQTLHGASTLPYRERDYRRSFHYFFRDNYEMYLILINNHYYTKPSAYDIKSVLFDLFRKAFLISGKAKTCSYIPSLKRKMTDWQRVYCWPNTSYCSDSGMEIYERTLGGNTIDFQNAIVPQQDLISIYGEENLASIESKDFLHTTDFRYLIVLINEYIRIKNNQPDLDTLSLDKEFAQLYQELIYNVLLCQGVNPGVADNYN